MGKGRASKAGGSGQASAGPTDLEWQRQLWALSFLEGDITNYLWLRQPDGEAMRVYREWLDGICKMLSDQQRSALKPLLEEVLKAHEGVRLEGDVYAQAAERGWSGVWRPAVDEPMAALRTAIRRRTGRLRSLIRKERAGGDKALDFLQAYCEAETLRGYECMLELACLSDCGRQVEPLAERCVTAMREAYSQHLRTVQKIPLVGADGEEQIIGYLKPAEESRIFWVSRDFEETEDCLRFLRFVETFGPTGFEAVVKDAQGHVRAELLAAGVDSSPFPPWATGELGREAALVALRFWPLVDVAQTAAVVRPAVDVGLDVLAAERSEEGFWAHPKMSTYRPVAQHDRLELLPDSSVTAAATLVLLRFGRKSRHRRAAEQGIEWSVEHQLPEGCWECARVEAGRPLSMVPSTEATCLALRALLLQERMDPADHVRRGVKWLVAQQSELGEWQGLTGAPQHHYTVMVLDTLRLCDEGWHPPCALSQYLATASRLLERSEELVWEQDEASRQIAVVLALQAVELFLYSCLEVPRVNVPVFDRSANQTIGYETALTRLEENLRSRKKLVPGAHVPGYPRLQRLKYLRDQVVHKGATVAEAEVQPVVDAAAALIEQYCPEYHGFSARGR